MDRKKLLRLEENSQNFYANKKTYICNYWIYRSIVAKTGYQVVFHLDGEGKVAEVKANNISCWFGFEYAYGG